MNKDMLWRIVRVILFLGVLYLFFVSIELMSASFKLMGKDFAKSLMTTTENPLVGLMIGILATSLVQSSSATTSIIVGLVAGGTLSISHAIPIVMGANIGTTVTNTLVSMGSIGRKNEFAKALAGATVHDFFNILAVSFLLPLEILTGFIEKSATFLETLFADVGGFVLTSPLKAIVKPLSHLFVDFFKIIIESPKWACALLVLVGALCLLFLALKYMVTLMKAMISGKVENLLHKYLFKSGLSAFLIGMTLTAVIQSSSATTSLIVPIVGAGILSLHEIFPYVLGSNVGTTITAILASMVTRNPAALVVAFSHLIFNLTGTILFYPLRGIPIRIATAFARFTSKYRLLAIAYIVVCFFAVPLLIIFLLKGGI